MANDVIIVANEKEARDKVLILSFVAESEYQARSIRVRKNKDLHKKPTNGEK